MKEEMDVMILALLLFMTMIPVNAEGLSAEGAQILSQSRQNIPDEPEHGDRFGYSLVAAKFTNDQYDDIAIGVPYERFSNRAGGAVVTLKGSSTGIKPSSGFFWSQNGPMLPDEPYPNDWFGESLATGDFNGDGIADLAIGIPGENDQAGNVQILYGKWSGLVYDLRPDNNQIWNQDSTNIKGESGSGDHFGQSLAVGDFNRDTYDDLAIGVPFEDFKESCDDTPAGTICVEHEAVDAGAVNIIYGSSSGLTAKNNQIIYLKGDNVYDIPEKWDHFGWSLATGKFAVNSERDRDEYDDLVISAPGKDIEGQKDVGAVYVFFGSDEGIKDEWYSFWFTNGRDLIKETPLLQNSLFWTQEMMDFGHAVAVGDFDGNGQDDIAISATNCSIKNSAQGELRTISGAGAVFLLYFDVSSLTENPSCEAWIYPKNSDTIPKKGDLFGNALAVGDFDGNHVDDMAVGVPGRDIAATISGVPQIIEDAGAVYVLYGSDDTSNPRIRPGLKQLNSQIWTQSSVGLGSTSEKGDNFGWALDSGNFNGDDENDLAIGIPGKDISGTSDAGSVQILYGSREPSYPMARSGAQRPFPI